MTVRGTYDFLTSDLKASVRTFRLSEAGNPVSATSRRCWPTRARSARGRRAVHPWAGNKIDKVAGIEARGFILGGAIAHQVSAGFVPIRKKGKLPHTTVRIAYSLEYGIDEMEMHVDAIPSRRARDPRRRPHRNRRHRGGRGKAVAPDRRQCVAACFIIDLPDLGGAAKLRAMDVPCAR